MSHEIIPLRLKQQEEYQCEVCGDTNKRHEACYVAAKSYGRMPEDGVSEGDRHFSLDVVCTECLARLNGQLKSRAETEILDQQNRDLINKEEAASFVDILEDQFLEMELGFDLNALHRDGEFVVCETYIGVDRVEVIDREDLINEITGRENIEFSRVDSRKWMRLEDRYLSS